MGQPASAFPPVDAELLQPQHEAPRKFIGPADVGVAGDELLAEGDHAHPSRLAVPAYSEEGAAGIAGDAAECVRNRADVGRRPAAEEGERNVEVVWGKNAHVGARKRLLLPGDESPDGVVGEPEGAEEPQPIIGFEPIG